LKTRCISALILATTSFGVPAGANTANQVVASKPGTVSATVGTSGAAAERLAVVCASCADLAFLGHRQRRGHVVEHQLDLPAHQVGDGELPALVGHVLHRRAGQAT
jgi:hypothetical protein